MIMNRLNVLDWVFLVLLVVGGLNWGLIGLFDYNLVAEIFGANSALSNLIYILVGASAAYVVISFLTKETRSV